jgi:hypothetical protein
MSDDIETSIQVELASNPIINNNTIAVITPYHRRVNNEDDDDLFSKICVSFWFTVILLPVIICDLYFAMNDKSCVNQTFREMVINMFVYLIVNSVTLIILILITYSIIFVFDSYTECTVYFSKCIANIINMFLFVWSIIGCVIYWHFMDTSICSTNVNNYLFVKFVITLITIASIIINYRIQ